MIPYLTLTGCLWWALLLGDVKQTWNILELSTLLLAAEAYLPTMRIIFTTLSHIPFFLPSFFLSLFTFFLLPFLTFRFSFSFLSHFFYPFLSPVIASVRAMSVTKLRLRVIQTTAQKSVIWEVYRFTRRNDCDDGWIFHLKHILIPERAGICVTACTLPSMASIALACSSAHSRW